MDFGALAHLQAERSALFSPISRSSSLEADRPEIPVDIANNPLQSAFFNFTRRVASAALAPSQILALPSSELDDSSWEQYATQGGFIFFLVVEVDPDSVTVVYLGCEGQIADDWAVLGNPGAIMTFLKEAGFYQVASPSLIRLLPGIEAALALHAPAPPPAAGADLGSQLATGLTNGLGPLLLQAQAQNQALVQATLTAAGIKNAPVAKQAEVDRLRRLAGVMADPRPFLSRFSSLARQPVAEVGGEDPPAEDAFGPVPPGLPTPRSLDLPSFLINLRTELNRGQGLSTLRYNLSEKVLRNLFAFLDFEESSIRDFHRDGTPISSVQDLHDALEDFADALDRISLSEFAVGVKALRGSLRRCGVANLKMANLELQAKVADFFLSNPILKDHEQFLFGRVYPDPLAMSPAFAVADDGPEATRWALRGPPRLSPPRHSTHLTPQVSLAPTGLASDLGELGRFGCRDASGERDGWLSPIVFACHVV